MSKNEFPESPFKADACKGRTLLISGGGSGIGFEIARQLGLHGARVCLMGRRAPVLEAAVAELRKDGIEAVFAQGDVRDFNSCKRAVDVTVNAFGRLDILVNCAAGNFLSPAENLSPNAFRTVLEIDTFGVFHLSQAAFPELQKAYQEIGDATIINITAEFTRPPFFQAHASAAKMAIDSLTRSHALEWGDYGIRVNGIAPGPIANTAGIAKLAGDANSRFDPNLPRGLKFGFTWDIGMACVFYVSKAGGYISGDIMVVDGAHTFRRGVAVRPDGHLQVDRKAVIGLAKQRESANKQAPLGVAGAATSKL